MIIRPASHLADTGDLADRQGVDEALYGGVIAANGKLTVPACGCRWRSWTGAYLGLCRRSRSAASPHGPFA